jgi:hypothetical protein
MRWGLNPTVFLPKKSSVSSAIAPAVIQDDPPPFKTPSFTLSWSDDPEAQLHYALKPDTAYILHINRGRATSGAQILQTFQPIAESRRIKVIGVDFLSIGFWEKMLERGLVHDWGMENPKMLL